MRRLDRNRVVRFRFRYDNIPSGSIARVVQFDQTNYALQLPQGFAGHNIRGLLKTPTGYFAPRDVLESTRVKVSGAREFNRRFKFTPTAEGACATKA